MTEDIRPDGALAAFLAEHNAKKAALVQAEQTLRDALAAVAPAPIPASAVAAAIEDGPPPAGSTTSEGKRAWWQQALGGLLALVGSAVAMLTASKPENPVLPIISAVIAALGALIGGNAQSVYTKARTAVKIGAAT